jgi:hypothetical protein
MRILIFSTLLDATRRLTRCAFALPTGRNSAASSSPPAIHGRHVSDVLTQQQAGSGRSHCCGFHPRAVSNLRGCVFTGDGHSPRVGMRLSGGYRPVDDRDLPTFWIPS